MKKLSFFIFLAVLGSTSQAQTDLKKPEASQEASVMQRIGLTDITIHYHSPLAKGRTIWGEVVPYNEVWRAGANENTTITFSTDVKVEGKAIFAGTYGLHMIPTQNEWTVIFSKNNYSWGSFFYSEKEDVLRVTVKPTACAMQDWLSYSFSDPQPRSVTVVLRWDKLEVPFKIEVDVPETVYQSMVKELSNINGFFWQGPNQAAAWCIQNNIHLDEASAWVEKSIGIQKNFANLTTKSRLLAKQGKTEEAEALRKEALPLADENQLNAYGYELLGQKKTAEALEIFRLNVKRHPDSWNVYDSLGEALNDSGNKAGGIENYKIALAKAPEGQKKRIRDILKKLESK